MSGHSKWSTIKRQKGAADAKRGQAFTKVANLITIASRLGGSGDPNSNPRLRMALDQARSINMPKDNIQRAIDRGLGKLEGQRLEEVVFEGFGPGRVAYVVEGVTDNRMRTLQEVRSIFERGGGSMGNTGSVSYMFEEVGEVKVKSKGGSSEDEMLELMDTQASDVEDFQEEVEGGGVVQKYLVYTQPQELNLVSKNITQLGFEVEESMLAMRPKVTQDVQDPQLAKRVIELTQKLEDLDDVQKVYPNFNIPDEIIATL